MTEALETEQGAFTDKELLKVTHNIKPWKAVKIDIPVEAFKAITFHRGEAFQRFLHVCNACWASKFIPDD